MATSRNRMWPFQIDRISFFLRVAQAAKFCSVGARTAQVNNLRYKDTNAGLAPAFFRTRTRLSPGPLAKGRELWASWPIKSKDFLERKGNRLSSGKRLITTEGAEFFAKVVEGKLCVPLRIPLHPLRLRFDLHEHFKSAGAERPIDRMTAIPYSCLR